MRRRRVLIVGLALACGVAAWFWFLPWPLGPRGPLAPGLAAYARGDWPAAADWARRRLSVDRDDPEATRLLARSSVRLGRDQAATTLYGKLASPKAATLGAEDYYLLGLALHRQHKTDGAIARWEAGLRLDPRRGELLDALARAYIEQNRFVEASGAAERLAQLPAWRVRASLMLGEARAALNDPAGAVEAIEPVMSSEEALRAATSAPAPFRRNLARNLLRLGRPEPATSQLRLVLRKGPDREASWLLSRALLQTGEIAEANAALGQAGPYRVEHPLEPEPSPFIGDAKCAECHRDVYRTALASRHARSLYRGAEIASLPLPDGPLPDPGYPGVTHTIARVGQELRVETRAGDRLYRAVIDHAFGTRDRYLSMVGRNERGEYRTVRLSRHQSEGGSGWDISAGDVAHPDHELGFLERPIEAREGAVRCLYCHATNVRGGKVRVGPESADHGIGCERCHGPGRNHLQAVSGQFVDMSIAGSSQTSTKDLTRLCNECHSLHSPEVARDVPRTDPIWHRSPGISFLWGHCVVESGERFDCLTCHDPHRPAETSAAFYEARCLSCHAATPPDRAASGPKAAVAREDSRPAPAARICPVNPRRRCLDCHMPRVRDETLHIALTDHYIRVRLEDARHVAGRRDREVPPTGASPPHDSSIANGTFQSTSQQH
jgi:tetratricopeptide (TPR) repeat protein